MGRNYEMMELKMYCHAVTERAVLISVTMDSDNRVWVAKSVSEFPMDPPSADEWIDINIPAWICEKEDFT